MWTVEAENTVGREVKAAQGLGVVSQQLPFVNELCQLLPAGKLGPFPGASGAMGPGPGRLLKTTEAFQQ